MKAKVINDSSDTENISDVRRTKQPRTVCTRAKGTDNDALSVEDSGGVSLCIPDVDLSLPSL